MLRHFLNATARTSSCWLLAKPSAPAYVLSSRSLFTKCNTPNFASSTVHTNSRSLLVKPNAPVYVSSVRSQSGGRSDVRFDLLKIVLGALAALLLLPLLPIIVATIAYGPQIWDLWDLVREDISDPNRSRVEKESHAEVLPVVYEKYGLSAPMYRVHEKATATPEFLEKLDDFKRNGIHVVETKNYYVVMGPDNRKGRNKMVEIYRKPRAYVGIGFS